MRMKNPLDYLTQNVLRWGTTNPDCMVWPGMKNEKSYGRCKIEGKVFYCHRVAYVLINGEIPKELELDHTCENTSCFNPAHLEAVTKPEHMKRTWERLGGNNSSRKINCPRGHPLIEGNLVLYRLKKGHRICLICQRQTSKDYMRRKRASL